MRLLRCCLRLESMADTHAVRWNCLVHERSTCSAHPYPPCSLQFNLELEADRRLCLGELRGRPDRGHAALSVGLCLNPPPPFIITAHLRHAAFHLSLLHANCERSPSPHAPLFLLPVLLQPPGLQSAFVML